MLDVHPDVASSYVKACSRRAFTLVELLVVIAIIAVLASLLLPTLQQAKDKAQQTTCVGSVKQIGLALRLYVDDNDDFWPYNAAGNRSLWAPQLTGSRYLERGRNDYDFELHCPAASQDFTVRHSRADYTLNWVRGWCGGGLASITPGSVVQEPVKERQITCPSDFLVLGESWDRGGGSSDIGWSDHRYWPGGVGACVLQTYRHLLGANYCHADGHSEYIRNNSLTFGKWQVRKNYCAADRPVLYGD